MKANRYVGRKGLSFLLSAVAALLVSIAAAMPVQAAVFNPGTGPDNAVAAIAAQPDGKLVMVGYFTHYNSTARSYIARTDTDGNLDTTTFPSFSSDIGAAFLTAVAVQSDGKIVIGGNFTNIGSNPYVARLNTDGTVDTNFANATPPADYIVHAVALLGTTNQKILIGGEFSRGIALLNPDGTIPADGEGNPTFNPGGTGTDGMVNAVVLQPDGKILIGGDFTQYNGVARNHIARLNADGTLDTTFDPGAGTDSTGSPSVSAIVVQADGKILIGGCFTQFNGTGRRNIARLNADGSLDTLFNPGSGFDNYVTTLALQSDGKIIVGGVFASFNGTSRNAVARLNSDGSLDSTFNSPLHSADWVRALLIQGDGRIVVGASQLYYQTGPTYRYLTRLSTDGTVDVTPPGSQAINFSMVFPGGRKYADWTTNGALSQTLNISATTSGGSGNPVYFTTDNPSVATIGTTTVSVNGSITTTSAVVTIISAGTAHFTANQLASIGYKAASTTDSNALTIGKATLTVTTPKVARPYGAANPTFVPSYVGLLNGDTPPTALTGSPQITTGADPTSVGGSYPITVAAGTLTSNNYAFTYVNNTMTVYSATSVSLSSPTYQVSENAGTATFTLTRTGGTDSAVVAKVTPNGPAQSPGDYSFTPGAVTSAFSGTADGNVYATAIQPNDGKLVIAGNFAQVDGTNRNRVARLNVDGTLDATFADPAVVGTVQTVAVQPDGKILIGGNFSTVGGVARNNVARLNSNGTLDTTFNPGTGLKFLGDTFSFVYSLAVQYDGKIVIGGYFDSYNDVTRHYLARVDSTGNLDTNFAPSFNNSVNSVAVQADGRIVVGGDFTTVNGSTLSRFVRLNPDGSTDGSFSVGTGADASVEAVAIAPDGKIVIGGTFTQINGTGINRIARLNTDGSVDSGFNVGSGANDIVRAISIQPDGPDGKVAIGGDFTSVAGTTLNGIARFNADGTIDSSFAPGAGTTSIYAMTMLQNGKFAVGGKFTAPRSHIMAVDGDLFATWPAGDLANKTISIPVVFNVAAQPDRTLNLALTAYGGATVTPTAASVLTIKDVLPIAQTITFNALSPVTYGAAPFTLTATGGASGNSIIFACDNASVATVNGSTVTIVGAGTANITASQTGGINGLNAYIDAAPVVQQLMVNKAVLTVTAQNASRAYGTTDPAFTYQITGYVKNDTSAVVSGTPSLSTTATLYSLGGAYPIIPTTGTLSTTNNYTFAFVNGTLTVGPAPIATITSSVPAATRSTSAAFTIGGSTVVTYSYQVDGGGYSGDITVSSGISLSGLGEGKHTLDVIGKNSTGAPQPTPTSFAWIVDVNGPVVTVSALPDQALTGDDTINVSGVATDAATSVTGVTVNGVPVTVHPDGSFSQALALIPGSNGISVIATDALGNQTTDSRSVTFDSTAPKLTIAAPADNISVRNAVLDLSGTMGPGVVSVGVKLNGSDHVPVINGTGFSAPLSLQSGINTIELSAGDGTRTSVAKRTVTYYPDGPTVEITDPSEDFSTANGGVVITGMIADATAPTVTVAADGQTYMVQPVQGGSSQFTFAQSIPFTAEKTYPIIVTVIDGSAQTVVQRNVIYRKMTTGPLVNMGSLSAVRGATVSVPVTLKNFTGTSVTGANVKIGYDPNLLQNPIVAIGAVATAAAKSISWATPAADEVTITLSGNMNTIADGALATVTFTVNPSIALNTSIPSVSATLVNISSVTDVGGNQIAASGSNGIVYVITKPGDSTGDGRVSIAEVQSAINMKLGTKLVSCFVDMNGDGRVSIAEVQKVINAHLGL